MPLSCSCDWGDYEFMPGEWYYDGNNSYEDQDFKPLVRKKRIRCCSCGILIDIGALSLHHPRVRYPYSEEESQIRCDRDLDDALSDEATIKIADHYQCEKCGEIWLNLQAVGFECLQPNENIPDMLAEYIEYYNPPKIEVKG